MNLKAFLALMLLVCIVLPALGQTQTQTPAQTQKPAADDKDDVVKITTNLVQVDAVVTKDGKPVTNLTADDFEIYEDGKRQAISSFAFISNVPSTSTPARATTDSKKDTPSPVVPYAPVKPNETRRTMAFVVDDLGLSAESMHQVKRQLRKFIAEQLQPNDLVAIVRTGSEMGALQQFTNDKRLLNRAVDQLHWNLCSRVGVHVLPPVGQDGRTSSVLFCGFESYKASLKSLGYIVDSMGYLPGRKSMVLLSDDTSTQAQEAVFDQLGDRKGIGSVEDDPIGLAPDSINYTAALDKIAERAIRSSVVIYSVDTQSLQYTGPTAADNITARDPRQITNLISVRSQLLFNRRAGGELIAKQTGGFQVHNSNAFQFDRILEDQSGYYLIGYRPTDETFNRSFHRIKAKVKRSGMSLRTRFGFFGVTEEDAARAKRPSAQDLTNLALTSPFAARDIEVDLTSFFVDDRAGGAVVRSFAWIDANSLTFTPVKGGQQGSIELHGAVFGDNGVVVQQVKRSATFTVFQQDFPQALANGIAVSLDMPVKRPGGYQARLVVRDQPTSRMGSAGQFVVVPDLKNKKPAVSGILLGLPNADRSMSNAGARRFRPNDDLSFAYNIYNTANETGQLRNLVINATLFRDDKAVYSGPEIPITASDPKDLSRVYVQNVIKLAPDLEPGNYYLQVLITDKDAKGKSVPVVQWIDFEIEK